MRVFCRILLSLIVLCVSATVAFASSVVSTGLAGVGNPEGNWKAFLSTDLSTSLTLTAVSNECCFGGVWYNSPGPANWITPYPNSNNLAANDPNANARDAEYFYKLAFDNPNQDLTIHWSSDNDAAFFLNTELLARSNATQTDYNHLITFTILAGDFLSGSNTFTVDLFNRAFANPPGNPTGLIVDVQTVPLPAALPLFAGGLGVMGWFARRKKRTAAS